MIRPAAPVLAAVLALAACGGGGDEAAPELSLPTFESPPAESTTTAATTSTTGPPRFETVVSSTPLAPNAEPSPSSIAPSTTSTTTTLPPPADPPAPIDCVSELGLRDRAALLVWPAVYSSAWPEAVAIARDQGVGGVVLMEPQGWSAADVAPRLAELERASRFGLVVATDEEGGAVQRLALLGRLPSQQEISETMLPEAARAKITEHGEKVRAAGIDMVLGPVVDVAPLEGEPPLDRSRFFTGGPAEVTQFAQAYLTGWRFAQVEPVLKHFPGHGSASADTHVGSGVTPNLIQLETYDLVPYQLLAAEEPAVMIGHLNVPGLNDDEPATRSRAAVDYLRDQLGYGDVLLITDALGMGAVGLPEPEASVRALQAGIDVVIFTVTSQTPAVIDAIVRAVDEGRLSEASVDASARKVMARLQAEGRGCT